MLSANKFLPLVEQRNKKRTKLITKINDSLLRDLSSATIKNYHSSFEQKQQQFQKFMLSKDDQTVTLAKKYLQRLGQQKKSLKKIAYLKGSHFNESKMQKNKTHESSQDNDKREQQKVMKIQSLINSLTASPKQPKSPLTISKDNSTVPHLACEEMRRMKSILFSSERRKNNLKSKQELIDRYGYLKDTVSKSLQNDIKVNKYKSSRYSKEDSIRYHKKLITEQYKVSLVAKNPQHSYKYDNCDDESDRVMKTLNQAKYQYFFSPPKRSKIKNLKSPKVNSQMSSKNKLSYRLDTFEPWEENNQFAHIQ